MFGQLPGRGLERIALPLEFGRLVGDLERLQREPLVELRQAGGLPLGRRHQLVPLDVPQPVSAGDGSDHQVEQDHDTHAVECRPLFGGQVGVTDHRVERPAHGGPGGDHGGDDPDDAHHAPGVEPQGDPVPEHDQHGQGRDRLGQRSGGRAAVPHPGLDGDHHGDDGRLGRAGRRESGSGVRRGTRGRRPGQ